MSWIEEKAIFQSKCVGKLEYTILITLCKDMMIKLMNDKILLKFFL